MILKEKQNKKERQTEREKQEKKILGGYKFIHWKYHHIRIIKDWIVLRNWLTYRILQRQHTETVFSKWTFGIKKYKIKSKEKSKAVAACFVIKHLV